MGAAATINQLLQGPMGQGWKPVSNEDGQVWKRIGEGNQVYHQYNPTNDLYPAETHHLALAKAIGVLVSGQYYFGAKIAEKVVSSGYHVYQNYQHMKGSDGFTMQSFAVSQMGELRKDLLQIGKDFVCFAPLYFDPMGLGTVAWWAAAGYAVYNPLMVRVRLNQIEEWICPRGEATVIPPLSQIFHMYKMQASSKKDD